MLVYDGSLRRSMADGFEEILFFWASKTGQFERTCLIVKLYLHSVQVGWEVVHRKLININSINW